MQDKHSEIKQNAKVEIANAESTKILNDLKVKYIGKNAFCNSTLTSIIIPWVDVNQKIEYINEDAELSGIFIIKSVSMDLAVEGTMTLECIRWYDYDPWDDK